MEFPGQGPDLTCKFRSLNPLCWGLNLCLSTAEMPLIPLHHNGNSPLMFLISISGQRSNIFRSYEEDYLESGILYVIKLAFKHEVNIKTFGHVAIHR